ncbi:MAG TPA: type II secretion system F family protein [Pirellulales bacterium]|nr:type II secretion system F family protein [Pirellulales bacterium]
MVESLTGRNSYSLDDLLALNDEIAALVRSGVPLESGLRAFEHELPGRGGRLAAELADRLARGEQLDGALLAVRSELPELYVSVVTAGLKSGRLAAALEGLASAARRIAELRQVTATAMIYPVVVFLLGWGLFVGFVAFFVPRVLPGFRDFRVSSATFIGWFADLAPSVAWWGPVVPIVILLAVAVWWRQSQRAMSLGQARWLAWAPGARRLLHLCHAATFADVLALLVDQRVPLGEGLRLAAAASGDRRMAADAQALASAIESGVQPREYVSLAGRFPPMVAWFLAAGQEGAVLVSALRHAAASYHERARQRAEAVQTFLPMFLTLLIGGTTVLAYALLLFVPWVNLLKTVSVQ